MSTWEVVLIDELASKATGVGIAVHDKAPVKFENHRIKNHCTNEEDMIAWEVKSTVKEIVMNKLSTKLLELLEDISRTSVYNSQSGLQSVEYNLAEQVMLDLLCKHVIREILYAKMVMYFGTFATPEAFLNSLLHLRLNMVPILPFKA